ncbi:ABC transporter permease subunit [Microbacterium sp. E-13]|uniref:ABC transporter permease subunit n=1 Tax=Microbacterium sp. E-13 TaxID=3404048 RepID=UPI003CE8A742
MPYLWAETVREWRWVASSRLLLLLVGIALVFAGGSAAADAMNAGSAAEQFANTASTYEANGQSVGEALAAPVHVTPGAGGQSNIDNPVRYDYEAYVAAAAAMSPTGASLTALSAAAFILVPVLAYILGVYVATHDLRSGAIIVRWPATHRAAGIVVGKMLSLAAMVAVVVVVVAATAAVVGIAAPLWRPALGGFEAAVEAAPQPEWWTVALLSSVLILVGAAFAAVGLLVASITRERPFTILLFAVPYFLLPLLGVADPRNLVPAAGQPWYLFVGGFQPQVVGPLSVTTAVTTLIVACVVATIGAGILWQVRDKTPRAT